MTFHLDGLGSPSYFFITCSFFAWRGKNYKISDGNVGGNSIWPGGFKSQAVILKPVVVFRRFAAQDYRAFGTRAAFPFGHSTTAALGITTRRLQLESIAGEARNNPTGPRSRVCHASHAHLNFPPPRPKGFPHPLGLGPLWEVAHQIERDTIGRPQTR